MMHVGYSIRYPPSHFARRTFPSWDKATTLEDATFTERTVRALCVQAVPFPGGGEGKSTQSRKRGHDIKIERCSRRQDSSFHSPSCFEWW